MSYVIKNKVLKSTQINPMIDDELLSSLIDLQIISQDIPSSFEFRFNLLDPNYKSKAEDIAEKTKTLFASLCSFILGEEVQSNDESLAFDCNKAVNFLLNSKEMRCLDKIPKAQPITCTYEVLEKNKVKFYYSPSVPKPSKIWCDISVPQSVPMVDKVPNFIINESMLSSSNNPIVIEDKYKLLEFIEITKGNSFEELYIAFLGHRIRTYREFPCLILIMNRDYEVLVFDLLKLQNDIGIVRDFLNNSPNPKVMFNSRKTIQMIAESYGFYLSNLVCVGDFDCSIESMLLEFGLKPVVVDWRIRPLTQELLEIAVNQVRYIPHLLNESKINNDIPIVLNNYEIMPRVPYVFNEQDSVNILQSIISSAKLELSEKQVNILRDLIKWRDSIASLEDESPNFIAKDSTLLKIALTEKSDESLILQNVGNDASPYLQTYLPDVLLILKQNINDSKSQLLF